MRTVVLFFLTILIFGVKSEAQVNLTNGLIAYYPFNGNANDQSGNANNGTVNGAILATDRFGNLNSAYKFDGINDYIEYGDLSIFDNSFSVSLWIYFEEINLSQIKRIIGKGRAPDTNTHNWSLNLETDNSISFFWEDENDVDHTISSINKVEAFKYYHLVISLSTNNNKYNLYINGVNEATGTMSSFPAENDDNLIIGARQGITQIERFINSHIDDVRIYNRTLNENEVQALYNINTLNIATFTTQKSISIYPNPANSLLNFSITQSTEYTVNIYNVLGELVLKQKNVSNPIEISMLPKGTYFLKVYNEKNLLINKKFIKI